MEGQRELISVIVPVYNIREYLERCVESILAQTWENLEVLLVDDGPTDGTEKLVDELQKRDGRIRVFHKENGGYTQYDIALTGQSLLREKVQS